MLFHAKGKSRLGDLHVILTLLTTSIFLEYRSTFQSDCFSPERPIVKGATSHIPETERASKTVELASTDPLNQSRHHSSSAAEPSHVMDSYESERRSDSPLQIYGDRQVEVSSSGSGGTQKRTLGERKFNFSYFCFLSYSYFILNNFSRVIVPTKKPELCHLICMLKLGKGHGQNWNNIFISQRTGSLYLEVVKQNRSYMPSE